MDTAIHTNDDIGRQEGKRPANPVFNLACDSGNKKSVRKQEMAMPNGSRQKKDAWTLISQVVIWTCLGTSVLGGCASVAPAGNDPSFIPIPTTETMRRQMVHFQSTSLMYLRQRPYKSIDVEVDVVEGAEPDDKAVAALAVFLETHCRKPVRVEWNEIIPADKADGFTPTALATQNMRRPVRDEENESSAYLYLMFYNGPKRGGGACALGLYPCGITVNMSRLRRYPFQPRFLPEILKHECAHVLGLCSNTAHGDGAHCTTGGKCIMNARHILKWSIWALLSKGDPYAYRAMGLCDDCKRDLDEHRESEMVCTTEMRGPFLIRKEKGYFVATLPSHLHLGLGSVDIPWKDVLERARGQAGILTTPEGYSTTFSYSYPSTEELRVKSSEAIEAALKDHDKRVVALACQMKDNSEIILDH